MLTKTTTIMVFSALMMFFTPASYAVDSGSLAKYLKDNGKQKLVTQPPIDTHYPSI